MMQVIDTRASLFETADTCVTTVSVGDGHVCMIHVIIVITMKIAVFNVTTTA